MRPTVLMKTLAFAVVALAALATTPARAQEFPTKPIVLVVPFAPGGFVHTVALLVGEQMEKTLGQQIVVQNRPGANGIVAADFVARAAPDGYTILLPTSSILTINPHLYKNVPFDPLSDFTPVGHIVNTSNLFVVSPRSGQRTLKDLVDAARGKPGTLSYGSSGAGSIQHITGELLKRQAGAELVHVPYKGIAPALVDVVGDRLGFVFSDASAIQQVKAGRLTAIAVSPSRLDDLPGVPSVAEAAAAAGLADFAPPTLWYGLVAPKNTPAPVVARLNGALAQALARPELRTRLLADGAVPAADPGAAAFGALIRADHARYKAMLERLAITVD